MRLRKINEVEELNVKSRKWWQMKMKKVEKIGTLRGGCVVVLSGRGKIMKKRQL